MKKSSKIIIFGGTGVLLTGLAVAAVSCGNDKELKLDKEASLTDVTTSITKVTTTEVTTTEAKTFVTTTKSGVETTIPVEAETNEVDVTYDTTIEAPIDEIPKNLISFGDNAQLDDVDFNIIINAPVYSVSAESVEIENGDQIIYGDTNMDSFNENQDSYNGEHTHVMDTTAAITTTAPVATTAPVTTTTVATTTNATTTKAVTTTAATTTKAPAKTTAPKTTEDTEAPEVVEETIEDFTPAIISLTAEDILKMSKEFAAYINENGIFSHRNYKYDKFNMVEMYSVVYLANMDFVSAEETKRLIEGGFISDDILVNIQNSFNFYSFYTTETVNRIKDGKTQILDLSSMMVDREAKKAFNAHESIITGFNTNKKSKNLKNYTDAAFYFAQGVTIKNRNGYDYSKSIYKTDREALSVGADYSLCYMGDCIDEIAKDFGIAVPEYSKIMQEGRDDLSDVVRVFESYTKDEKCYTKTR